MKLTASFCPADRSSAALGLDFSIGHTSQSQTTLSTTVLVPTNSALVIINRGSTLGLTNKASVVRSLAPFTEFYAESTPLQGR